MSQRLRIVVAEDDERLAALVEQLLDADGRFEVVGRTADGDEVVRLVEAQAPDLVLMDIGLPGQDGYEFMQAVRSDPALAKLPAAALTAYARAEDRRRALAVGFQMHVSKPVEPAELIAVVTNLTRIGAVMRSSA